MLPLIASADPMRANRDPEIPEDWPCDQRQLRDDLWSMALWLQAEAADVWTTMSRETSTLGRDWERWRALMTVARLLEAHGVEGLERDMRHVMSAYHQQKGELEAPSREALVIRALMRVVNLKEVDVWTSVDVMDIKSETRHLTSTQIVEKLKELLADADGGDDEEASTWASPRTVGRLLTRLRFKEHRGPPPKRERFRAVTPREIAQLAIAHHIVHLSEEMSITSNHVHMSTPEQRFYDDVDRLASGSSGLRGSSGIGADAGCD